MKIHLKYKAYERIKQDSGSYILANTARISVGQHRANKLYFKIVEDK